MKAKKAFTVLGLLAAMILSVAFASAQAITISNLDKPTSVNEASGSFTFTFDVTYSGASPNATLDFSDSSTNFGSLAFSNPGTFNGSANEAKTVTGTVTGYANQGGNDMQITLNISGPFGAMATGAFIVLINNDPTENFCPAEVGDLEISDFNINNFGEGDDEEWQPLDRIEIEVEIENTNRTEDVDDVMVEIKILDKDGNDVTSDFEFEDEEIDLGRIRDDDAEIATFIIEEVPADLEEDTYKIFIKAYSDGEEELQCVSEARDFNSDDDNYHEIDFKREEDQAVVVRLEDLRQDVQAICGERNVQVTFPVYNLGTDKEDKILVNLYNRDLGIDEYEVIDNLRSGKRKEVTFMVNIPENAYEESYGLEIFTHFDYDEDEDEMEESSYDLNSRDDLEKDFEKELVIVSCEAPAPSITANLGSEADVGSDMVVRVRITNNGNQDQLYSIDAIGYESWADLKEITPRTITIDAGETEEISITMVPTEAGLNSFRLVTNTGGQEFSQPVSVNVAGESSNESETKGALGELFKNKLLTYVIIGIAVLIILILIVLIGRLSSSSRRAKAE